MAEHPLKILEKVDPELLKRVKETSSFALEDGTLPKKFKLLIATHLTFFRSLMEQGKLRMPK